jgi:hypothetical protein
MKQKTYFHTDENGVIREIDGDTGEIIAKSPSFQDLAENHYAPISVDDTTLARRYMFSIPIAEFICQKIAEGSNLTDICKMPGVPSYTIITRWRAEHPEFAHGILMARKAKAELFEAKIEESLDRDLECNKDWIPGRQLWFKKMKFLASVHNPDTYGAKPEGAKGGGGVTIIVDTGVRKPGDIVETECTNIGETDGHDT